jgi:hypothetical protein
VVRAFQLFPAKPVRDLAPSFGDEEIVRQRYVALPIAVILGLAHNTAFHDRYVHRQPTAADRDVRLESNVIRLGVRRGRELD